MVLKILGALFLFVLISVIGAFLFFIYRTNYCRESSDTMVKEFSIGQTSKHLFTRANELGFTGFVLRNPRHEKDLIIETDSNLNQISLEELQRKLDEVNEASVQVYIVPIPPFLRWILNFTIEAGVIKTVEKSQLD